MCAASEHSGLVVLGPGLGLEHHVEWWLDPGNQWEWAAGAARFERPAAGPGDDAVLPSG